ncbi:MAG TPA: ESPR-type extended signal peptide-containing protein, partial [Noviherbaspirillum sp.]
MNKHLYRIVFNKTRGLLMAVSEIAKAGGKGKGGPRGERGENASGVVLAKMHPLAFAAKVAAGASMFVMPLAGAQIVADPSAPAAQRPTVLNTANGLPQVNIQTSSAAGVSRNTYSQFDVQSNGAILNNSRINVETQTAGWVQANPWLAGGSARVILNEVNSANPSYLRGYVEVAG